MSEEQLAREPRDLTDDELASVVVDDLVAAGLIPQSRAQKTVEQMRAGRMKIGDWRLLLETTSRTTGDGTK